MPYFVINGQGGPFFGCQNDIIARIAESSSNWFYNENDDLCDENNNNFDDYGDED